MTSSNCNVDDQAVLVCDYATGRTLELTNAHEVNIGCATCGHKTGRRGRFRVQKKKTAADSTNANAPTQDMREALVCQDTCAEHWQMSLARPAQYTASVGVNLAQVRTAASPLGEVGWCVACGVLPAQVAMRFPPQSGNTMVGVCSHQCQDRVEHDVHTTLLGAHLPLHTFNTAQPVNISSVMSHFRKGYDTRVLANQLYALRDTAEQDNAQAGALMRDRVRPQLVYWLHHYRFTLTAKGVHTMLDRFYGAVNEEITRLELADHTRELLGGTSSLFVGEIEGQSFNDQLLAMHLARWVQDYADDPLVRGGTLVRESTGRIYRMLWSAMRNSVADYLRAVFGALSAGVVDEETDGASLLRPTFPREEDDVDQAEADSDASVQSRLVGGPLDALKSKAKNAVTKAASAVTPKPYSVDTLANELTKIMRVQACFQEQEAKLGNKRIYTDLDMAIVRGAAYEAWMEGILPAWIDTKSHTFVEANRLQVIGMRAMFDEFQRRLGANTLTASSGKFNAQRDCKAGAHTTNPSMAGKQLYAMFTRYASIDGMAKQADKDKVRDTLLKDFDKLVARLVADTGSKQAGGFLGTYLQALYDLASTLIGDQAVLSSSNAPGQ